MRNAQLDGGAQLSGSAPGGELTLGRVTGLLGRLRPLLSPDVRSDQTAPALDIARLSRALTALRPILQKTRASGAFLNVWSLAGLRRDEVRTSAVLAWLLDPNGSHGCGDVWLQAFWRAACSGAPRFELANVRGASTEVTPLGDGADRIDVAVEGDDFVVYVEVKIDAVLQPNQLERYRAAADAKARLHGRTRWAVVFLAELDCDLPDGCVRLRWRDVARAIEAAAAGLPQAALGVCLARQFATHVAKLH